MPDKLRTPISALLPPTRGIRLLEVALEDASVRLQVTVTAPTAACPRYAVPSSSVHSHYQRHLTDLPWGTRAVRIQLTVRTFRCRNRACGRRIFTERVPDLVAAYSRNTHRLATVLRTLGLALGGNPGARLAACLRLPTSPSTLLRLVRGAPIPPTPALQAVGVDEWAWRRGHRYGTILVNLADHRLLGLTRTKPRIGTSTGLLTGVGWTLWWRECGGGASSSLRGIRAPCWRGQSPRPKPPGLR
jgi:transposase